MEDIARVLPAFLKEFDENDIVREAVVFAVWRKIAGESLRTHAVPFRLFKKQLIIAVSSAAWKKHLEALSGQMIFKLNSVLQQAAVTFIEFRIDEETILTERAKHQKNRLSDSELEEIAMEEVTPKIRLSAEAIKDDYLRTQFLLAAGSCLARKKKMK